MNPFVSNRNKDCNIFLRKVTNTKRFIKAPTQDITKSSVVLESLVDEELDSRNVNSRDWRTDNFCLQLEAEMNDQAAYTKMFINFLLNRGIFTNETLIS